MTPSTPAADPQADARNRAWRTALQVLALEVAIVVIPLVMDALDGTDPVRWAELGRSCVRVALGAFLAWAMRHRLPPPAPEPIDQPTTRRPRPLRATRREP